MQVQVTMMYTILVQSMLGGKERGSGMVMDCGDYSDR